MKYRGVIFDFNGTLYWDTPLHDQAFDIFLKKHNIVLTAAEKKEKIHGKTNNDIFQGIFERNLSAAEIYEYTMEKETTYQNISREKKLPLAPGARELIFFLRSSNIKYTIATSSGLENVDFYFSHLKLNELFDREKIVYSNGILRGKPHPDLFLEAIKVLDVEPDELVVFEDSVSGIIAAEKAGIGKIFIVNSNNEDYSNWNYDIITDFNDIERSMFIQ
ncbi:MAG TPA: HAD family phosphatase [Candidatus Wallbacteria bacterium]|nr:HAD family phosphatase [Candidatus Wallbacteria bacterium]